MTLADGCRSSQLWQMHCQYNYANDANADFNNMKEGITWILSSPILLHIVCMIYFRLMSINNIMAICQLYNYVKHNSTVVLNFDECNIIFIAQWKMILHEVKPSAI